mmetsp:Transcript_2120/g.5306  ORF Transcript_2120/g.5306 Transcript_2120/m.5306 type:complete len:396 (+) Transcript_2120:163-1350(+)
MASPEDGEHGDGSKTGTAPKQQRQPRSQHNDGNVSLRAAPSHPSNPSSIPSSIPSQHRSDRTRAQMHAVNGAGQCQQAPPHHPSPNVHSHAASRLQQQGVSPVEVLLPALMAKCNEGVHLMNQCRYLDAIETFSFTLASTRAAVHFFEQQQHQGSDGTERPAKRARSTVVSRPTPPTAASAPDRSATEARALRFTPSSAPVALQCSHGYLYQDARLVEMLPGAAATSTRGTPRSQPQSHAHTDSFQSLCAVTIYNTALAHQLHAASLQQQSQARSNRRPAPRTFLIRALRLYEQAYILFSASPEQEMQQDVTRALGILSNVGILYAALDQPEQANKCWMRLLDFILRLSSAATATSRSSDISTVLDHFFTNVSHLFSLSTTSNGSATSTTMAPAA